MIAVIATLLMSCCHQGKADSAPKKEPIEVMMLIILATDKNKDVHERLGEIAAEIRKKDPALTGFDLKKTYKNSIKIGETVQIDLVNKARAEVTINEKTDDAGRATITVKLPKLDEITYVCTCGKFFPIITNYYTAEKQRLIIAIMAKPCKKKEVEK